MGWSIKLFTVGGTAVRMHLTFLLLLVWIAGAELMRGTPRQAVYGVVFILVLFACVVLHEFGHIWAARRYGIRTPDVTLLPIGGVASMERMPEKPSQEIVVALAGPAVNLIIAVVLALVLGVGALGIVDPTQMAFDGPYASFLAQVAVANVILLVFNLIPAFPMDGGRVLRALLAMWLGYGPATRVAARIGQALAVLFAVLGFMGNPLLVLIAVFIFLAAGGEAGYVRVRELTRGRPVTEAMITSFEVLGVMATVDDAAALLLRSGQQVIPIVDGAGRLRGMLNRAAVVESVRNNGGGRPVLEVMTADVKTVPATADLEAAVTALQQSRAGSVGVVDAAGKLAGYVTADSIREAVAIGQGRAKGPLRAAG
jgi:Zn-dependent protease/CBS domain-containing protein